MDARQIHLDTQSADKRSSYNVAGEPVSAFRGILVGLWLTCTTILLLALVPGLDITLGNLPGDFDAGTNDGSVRLPLATLSLVVVTLTGLYFRIASHLSRH